MQVAEESASAGIRLGRAVTFADMAEIHAKAHPDCSCNGTARLRQHIPATGDAPSRIVANYCYVALQDLQVEGMQRIVEHPQSGDAHWIAGRSPEEWAFTLMFFAHDFEHCWSQAFSYATRDLWMRPPPEARA